MKLFKNWNNNRRVNSYNKKIEAIDLGVIHNNVIAAHSLLEQKFQESRSWETVSKDLSYWIENAKSFVIVDSSLLKVQIRGIDVDEESENKMNLYMSASFSEEEQLLQDFISFYSKEIRDKISPETKDVYIVGADVNDTMLMVDKFVNMMKSYVLFLERGYEYSKEKSKMVKKIPFGENKVWKYVSESRLGDISSFLEDNLQEENILIIRRESSLNFYSKGEDLSFMSIIIDYKNDIDISFSNLSLEKSEYYYFKILKTIENIAAFFKSNSKVSKVETKTSTGLENTLSSKGFLPVAGIRESKTKKRHLEGRVNTSNILKKAKIIGDKLKRDKMIKEQRDKEQRDKEIEEERQEIVREKTDERINPDVKKMKLEESGKKIVKKRRNLDKKREDMDDEERIMADEEFKILTQWERNRVKKGEISKREKKYIEKAMSVCGREFDDVRMSAIVGNIIYRIYILATSSLTEDKKNANLLKILDFIDQDLLGHTKLIAILNKIVSFEFKYISSKLEEKKLKEKQIKKRRNLDKKRENMTDEDKKVYDEKRQKINELEKKRMEEQNLQGLEKEYFEKAMTVCYRDGDDVLISRIIGTIKSKIYMLVVAPISDKQREESLLDIMDFIDQDLLNHRKLIKILNEFIRAEFESASDKHKKK